MKARVISLEGNFLFYFMYIFIHHLKTNTIMYVHSFWKILVFIPQRVFVDWGFTCLIYLLLQVAYGFGNIPLVISFTCYQALFWGYYHLVLQSNIILTSIIIMGMFFSCLCILYFRSNFISFALKIIFLFHSFYFVIITSLFILMVVV